MFEKLGIEERVVSGIEERITPEITYLYKYYEFLRWLCDLYPHAIHKSYV